MGRVDPPHHGRIHQTLGHESHLYDRHGQGEADQGAKFPDPGSEGGEAGPRGSRWESGQSGRSRDRLVALSGERDPEFGALSVFCLDLDLASVFLNDLVEIERPRPVPWVPDLVVKKGSKIFFRTSSGIPVPLSRTVTLTLFSCPSVPTVTVGR